ncbi:peroxide stress protein YaaA [uncultured Limosilactobacillus sp.]|uniref:peroxide stress protein YaaA n=1 Tax=uncultured Limosilactobacillus sp. TaxID=2837629 RepID=UPI0025F76039|nr:peroxide stress protein YaaA [uncultured Limosilactobacillus sp.]
MQIIISPARRMQTDLDAFPVAALPQYLKATAQILNYLRQLSYQEIHRLWWNCSERLARPNYEWVHQMNLRDRLTPAIIAFTGLQYQYMAPDVFSDEELKYVQHHLKIMSGFYGMLRPFDGIVQYRLGMGDRAHVNGTQNLYQFWGDRLANDLYQNDRLVLNLASQEYSKAIQPYADENRQFITCRFVEIIDGRPKQKATLAKMARGNMVRFLARQQATTLEQVKQFNLGYRYCEKWSNATVLTFLKAK